MSRFISTLAICSLFALPSCKIWNDIMHGPSVVPRGSKPVADPLLNQPVPQVQPVERTTPTPEPPPVATGSGDGLRLPEMLDLPSDSEFRSTNPDVKKSPTGDGPVISRPPTDPPSRPKPAE